MTILQTIKSVTVSKILGKIDTFTCFVTLPIIFSERELTFTFAIYVIGGPSVVCLSSVCNVGAPYSGD